MTDFLPYLPRVVNLLAITFFVQANLMHGAIIYDYNLWLKCSYLLFLFSLDIVFCIFFTTDCIGRLDSRVVHFSVTNREFIGEKGLKPRSKITIFNKIPYVAAYNLL